MPVAPPIIHFIWLGSHIPEKYLASIYKLNLHLKANKSYKIKINLWCDKIINIHATAGKLGMYNIDEQISIKIIENDLLPNMQADSFYTADTAALDRFKCFKFFTQVESMGAHNFATVSDIYRLEILRQFGGCYCDTDNQFQEGSIAIEEELPYGIKVCFESKYKTWRDLFFMHASSADRYANTTIKSFSLRACNDIILAMPHSEFIRYAIKFTLFTLHEMHNPSLVKYSALDEMVSDNLNEHKRNYTEAFKAGAAAAYNEDVSRYDNKRCILNTYGRRKILSIHCGPGAIIYSLRKLITHELSKIDVDNGHMSLEKFVTLNHNLRCASRESNKLEAFGMPITVKHDLTWLKKPTKGVRPRSYTI